MALSGQQFTIRAGYHQATITEVGAVLRRYTFGGADVVASFGEDEVQPRSAGGVLVPWPNRLRGGRYTFDGQPQQVAITEPDKGNALHGLGRWVRWAPLRAEQALVSLGVDLVPQKGWPFEVRVEVTYGLNPEFGLTVTAVARNTGARRAPFGAGFHPYLALHGHPLDEVTLRLPASQHLVIDEAAIPVGVRPVAGTPHDFRRGRRLGRLRLDDAYTGLELEDGRGVAELHTGSGAVRVWFDSTFRYLQVFTAERLIQGLPAIAVEPMTCPADAFNTGTGLIVLEPGGSWTGSWGISPIGVEGEGIR
ncbi:MAG: aldose 1-epimerase family protein [Actinomycetota bacterium]